VNRAGLPFALGGIGAALFCVGLWLGLGWEVWRVLGVLSSIFTLFCILFFRDPERLPPAGEGLVVSPADGKVVEIVTEDDPHVGPDAQRVSIFLSILSVHVNRIPMSGHVAAVDYRPGRYLMAFAGKASQDNEQTHIGLVGARGAVAFKQIAGFIARRIVCTLSVGDSVRAGDRCGLIRFGSRVDVILPPDARLRVGLGEHVRGGETIIGELP